MKRNIYNKSLLLVCMIIMTNMSMAQIVTNETKRIKTKNNEYRAVIKQITEDSLYLSLVNGGDIVISRRDVKKISDLEYSDKHMHYFEMRDGSKIYGTIEKVTEAIIEVELPNKEKIELNRSEIKKYKEIDNSLRTNYYSQPFYVPTAFASGRGNNYMRTHHGFLYDFNFGVSDKVDLSVGTEIISLVSSGGDFTPGIQLGAKTELAELNNNIRLGAGFKFVFNSEGSAVFVHLPITVGNKKSNFSIVPVYLKSGNDDLVSAAFTFNASIGDITYLSGDALYAENELGGSITLNFVSRRGYMWGLGALFLTDAGATPNVVLTVPLSGDWDME